NSANPLADGTYTMQARVIDAAGNIGTIDSQNVVIDTTPPAPTIDITAITDDTGASATDFNTGDNTLVFSCTRSAVLAPGESVQISLDNGVTWLNTTLSGTTWSFDHSGTVLLDGTYVMQVRVIDAAGNIGQTDNQDVVIDTLAPAPTETIAITAI